MASRGWCHPARKLRVSPLFFPEENWPPFWSSLSLLLISLGCRHLEGVTHTFLPVRPALSTIFFKFSHNFFLRVSPPGGCHPGRSPSPLPSDATDLWSSKKQFYYIFTTVSSHRMLSAQCRWQGDRIGWCQFVHWPVDWRANKLKWLITKTLNINLALLVSLQILKQKSWKIFYIRKII